MKLKFVFLLLVLLMASCKSERNVINTTKAPLAIGPYSQAVHVGNTLYSSGQIAIDPHTNKLINGTIRQQTDRIMANHLAILQEANMDFSNIVKVTVYLTDLSKYSEFNTKYSSYFKSNAPARETVEVSSLPAGAKIEISLIAVK